MNRIGFLKYSASVATASWLLSGLTLQSCYREKRTSRGRVLVLVQLDGGNDGLNTIIPIDQYANLSKARSNVLIPEKKILPLSNSHLTGFHPALTEFQELYNDKKLTVVQGVGYPNPIFSHFRAIDIWHTGSGSGAVLNSGWLGRYLNHEFPNYPQGYPNNLKSSPPAVQVGAVLSNALQGYNVGMGMAINSTNNFYNLILAESNPLLTTPMGHELSFVSMMATQTQKYLEVVKKAAKNQKNLSTYYPPNGVNLLADQLKIVAQLIGGGLETKVYIVNLSGFDTHHNQVSNDNTTKGKHSELLRQLSQAIKAFENDIELMGMSEDVLGMVYSEFGRRIKSNASGGTDHGSSGPVIFFGSKLKGGLVGNNPHIPDVVTVDDNLEMQYDYRSLYTSVLKDWFGVPDSTIQRITLSRYPTLDLFD
jgi:uncharacterized protein (DUF1501 family)